MERHPLACRRMRRRRMTGWCVAGGNKIGDAPDFSSLVCFRAGGDQGLVIVEAPGITLFWRQSRIF